MKRLSVLAVVLAACFGGVAFAQSPVQIEAADTGSDGRFSGFKPCQNSPKVPGIKGKIIIANITCRSGRAVARAWMRTCDRKRTNICRLAWVDGEGSTGRLRCERVVYPGEAVIGCEDAYISVTFERRRVRR